MQVWKEGKRVLRQFPSGLLSLSCAQAIEGDGVAPTVWYVHTCDLMAMRFSSMLVSFSGGRGGMVIVDAIEGSLRSMLPSPLDTTNVSVSGLSLAR